MERKDMQLTNVSGRRRHHHRHHRQYIRQKRTECENMKVEMIIIINDNNTAFHFSSRFVQCFNVFPVE